MSQASDVADWRSVHTPPNDSKNDTTTPPAMGRYPSRLCTVAVFGAPHKPGRLSNQAEPSLVAHRNDSDSNPTLTCLSQRPRTQRIRPPSINTNRPIPKLPLVNPRICLGLESPAWYPKVLTPVDILSVDSKSSSVLDFPRWKSLVFSCQPQYIGSAGPRS